MGVTSKSLLFWNWKRKLTVNMIRLSKSTFFHIYEFSENCMNVNGQVLNLVKYQVSHCFKTKLALDLWEIFFCTEKLPHADWGKKDVWVQKVHRQCSVMFSLSALPAVITSTHLCTHLEVSSERNFIMGEQLLFYFISPTPGQRGFEFDWVEASFSMIW